MSLINTVRIILTHNGKLLMLQKSSNSKNPYALEFPGGKIEESHDINPSSEEIVNTAVKELLEETMISITPDDVIDSGLNMEYSFEVDGERYERVVHYVYVDIDEAVEVRVNQLRNTSGEAEDRHHKFLWISSEDYNKIKENPTDNLFISENSKFSCFTDSESERK